MTMNVLSPEQKRDLERRGFSRRNFGRIAALVAGGASLPFYSEPALAQLSQVRDILPGSVMINSNENPLGPCPEALQAATEMVKQGGRYLFNVAETTRRTLAEQEGLDPQYVMPYAGSSAPLHQTVLAFCGPNKPLVTGDPGYEAAERAATVMGAEVIRVPLMKDKAYAHDVRAMAKASPTAGVIYLCNPNNPTGTVTPAEDIEWLVDNKPKGTIILLDEAYTHIAGVKFHSDLVAKGKDIVILRTFSKIYGMAGLRAGAVFARPDLMANITKWSQSGSMLPITSMAAATASLKSASLVPERREKIGAVREDVQAYFKKNNVKFVPSVSNCIMVDAGAGKTPNGVIAALAKEKVVVGRVWPSWPSYYRITIGTQDEMNKFKEAFSKVNA